VHQSHTEGLWFELIYHSLSLSLSVESVAVMELVAAAM
jgi:hypothetical protein